MIPGNRTPELADDRAEEGIATLVRAAPSGDARTALAMDLLAAIPPRRENVLAITYRQSPDVWLEDWNAHVGEPPAELGVVTVGEPLRSASVPPRATRRAFGYNRLEVVSDPGDLATLGAVAAAYLDRWEGNGNRTVVCFDSVTDLLSHAPPGRAFRLLRALCARLDAAGARSYFLLDEGERPEREERALSTLFDEQIDGRPDGRPG